MMDLFGNESEPVVLPAVKSRREKGKPDPKINPLINLFGSGPEGAKCKTCKNLYAKQYDKRYYKCKLRGDTNGYGTDHRVRWQACAKYEREEP